MSIYPVVIVGAGMAGLAAGRTLQASGHEPLILEARARPGGRTHTDHSLGVPIDMGAAWIHGPVGNPLTPLAEQFGVSYTPSWKGSPADMLVFRADGSALNEGELAEFGHGRQLAAAAMTRAAASLLHGADVAVVSHSSLCENVVGEPPGLSGAARLGFRYGSRISPATYESADPAQIDWRLTNDYTLFPGDDLLLYGGGYGQIIAGLAEGLTIRYDAPVRQIRRTPGHLLLTLASGETIMAEKAVITIPLGVLKAGAIQFEPPLPAAKQAAIDRIGYGSFEKLALRFDQCYWPADKQQFLYFEADAATGDEAIFLGWVNLAAYNGEPILVTLCSGPSRVRRWHSHDDDALCAAALTLLRRLFGPMPAPLSYARTGWQADPYSQGGYSFQQVGQQPTDRATLAQPIDDQIYFAGEAIHPHFFATVHGAYESGVWAAQQLV